MSAKPPAKKRSLYDILGVQRDAMAIDIGVAYKKRLAEMERRPDSDPQEIALVREAYHILCQPKEREAYDSSLITREEREEAKAHGAPDLVLDADDDETLKARGRKRGILIGAIIALVIVAAVVFSRPGSGDRSAPPVSVAAEKIAAPAPPPPPKTRDATEILGIAAPVVAGIVAYDISGKPKPVGNGVLVAPDAIVTTCHALPASATIVARVGVESVPATVAIFDEDLDLCRLMITPVSARPIVPNVEEPKAGDKVFVVGYHQEGVLSVVEGKVTAVRAANASRLIDLSVTVPAGASGGGLFDAYGRLVGVLTDKGNAAIAAATLAQMRTRGQPPPKQ
jgi:serine protease Do